VSKSIGTSEFELRGGVSHLVWRDDRAWDERPMETCFDALARHRRGKPDAVFLRFGDRSMSFAELDASSIRMAGGLAARGVTKGDRVAVVMDNSLDMVVTFFAVTRLGAIWVPTNTAYRGEFLKHQLHDCGAKIVICDADYAASVVAVEAELPSLELIVVGGARGGIRSALPTMQLEALHGDTLPTFEVVHPSDVACLIYTSGTTGLSKGCMLSHNCLCGIGRRRNVSVPALDGDVTWSCLPLFHIASLCAVLIANLLEGQQAAFSAHFSASRFWDDIERCNATSAVLLATMFTIVANAADTPAMKRCHGRLRVVTGVPISQADRKIWQERFGVPYLNSFAYGQTEANFVTLLPWGHPEPPFNSMGPPSVDFDVMVAQDRLPVAIGAVGELLVRPRHPDIIFSGYWKQPAATLDAMQDLWWHTGDLVRMDDQGRLYFVDRKKDYLRSRGENISSFEIESALMKHASIQEVTFHAVHAVDGIEVEALKATVVLRPDSRLTQRELFDWAVENLPYFAVPRFIEFRDALPKTPTGRVQKSVLREEGTTQTTWDAHAAGLKIGRKR
jgi:crotonobetaine/carnitine-CoA ligase